MEHEYIIVHADKTVLKIAGLKVKGLNTKQLEELLSERLHTYARVIGVTGDSVEMDIYGIDPARIEKEEEGILHTVALAEGIKATDIAKIVCNEKIVEVDIDTVPATPKSECRRERWMKY